MDERYCENIKSLNEKKYFDEYVQHRMGPYSIQFPGKQWFTRYKSISDPLVKGHLDGKYYVATKGPYYPNWGYIDLDHPDVEASSKLAVALGFDDSQYMVFTSPSYKKTGNIHIMFKPCYSGKPMTQDLFRKILEPVIHSLEAELYPQKNRKFRLPFGKNQRPIDANGAPVPINWQECMFYVDKLEDFEVSNITHQLLFDFGKSFEPIMGNSSEAFELLQYGLQGFCSRHNSCLKLAILFYRRNCTHEETKRFIKQWIHNKHNNYSKEINKGNWWLVNREIDEIVNWVYSNYTSADYYPDDTHNSFGGWLYASDMHFITKVFRGDIVNMHRLFNLLKYYRPRSSFPWVYISKRAWEKIISRNRYKEFQDMLKVKGLLRENSSYLVGSYSKQYRLSLPNIIQNRLEEDGRAVQDFRTATLKVYKTEKDVREALNLNRMTVYRLFNEK